jgi:Holliday junction DNA helicase RuvA
MIARIRGRVLEARLTSIVIDVSGLGYEVTVAPEISGNATLGGEIELFTSQVIREDSWTLYGFLTSNSRDLFDELQTVTGVGPKVAHSLLSMFAPDELRNHIGQAEVAALEKVPGIGKKVAARIILELQEKFRTHGGKNRPSGKWRNSLKDALITLGYSAKEAEKAIDQVVSDLAKIGETNPENLELSELLKKTLNQARK